MDGRDISEGVDAVADRDSLVSSSRKPQAVALDQTVPGAMSAAPMISPATAEKPEAYGHRSMRCSPTIGHLGAALARAQGEFAPIRTAKTVTIETKAGPTYSYRYADLAACLAAVRPALARNGIMLVQPVEIYRAQTGTDSSRAVATTLLTHGPSGEWMASDFPAHIASTMDPKVVGSSATYARRYGLLAALGIAPEDEDDDGTAASTAADEPESKHAAKGFDRTAEAQAEIRHLSDELRARRERDAAPFIDDGKPVEPFDPMADKGWLSFLMDANVPETTPEAFLDGVRKRVSKAATRKALADTGAGALITAARKAAPKSPVVADVAAELAAIYNARHAETK